MSYKIKIEGHKFGRLTVVRYTEIIKGRSCCECLCDCGNTIITKVKYILNGDTKSCGCLKKDTAIINSRKYVTHGMTNSLIYKVWSSMKDRCLNEKCHAYKDYGGRGISICKRWHSFTNFYEDMGSGYNQGLELDRERNNEGYSIDNCRWVTPTVNKRNRRGCVFLTVDSQTKHISEWSDLTGISRHSIYHRIMYEHKTGTQALYGKSIKETS
jgi:hypothetical protein